MTMRALIAIILLSGAAVALASRPSASGRSLLQATCSESDGCKLCPDGCTDCRRDTNGNFRCTLCAGFSSTDPKASRIPSADGSCGCAAGYYLGTPSTAEAKRCIKCDVNNYCPGGTQAESTYNQDNDPGKVKCPPGLVTRYSGAALVEKCVNAPGCKFIKATANNDPSQEICPENTWSAGYRKQATCTPCPSGLKTANGLLSRDLVPGNAAPTGFSSNNGESTTGVTGSTTASACKVPPGYYGTGSNKVIRCPKGEYRAGYVASGDPTVNKCVRCPRGTTTFATASPGLKFCDVLLPGYYWVNPGVGAESRPDPATSSPSRLSGDGPYTKICDQNCICKGGYPLSSEGSPPGSGRIPCENSLWTKNIGARAVTDCLVPPGHKYLPTAASPNKPAVTQCSEGEYSPDWRLPGATDIGKCQTCGLGIKSEPVETLYTYTLSTTGGNPGFSATKDVLPIAGTSATCYINAGEGMMMATGSTASAPTYRKIICNGNRYGVALKQNELRVTPCKDCPRGTTTNTLGTCPATGNAFGSSTTGFTDPQACCTPPGYGFDGGMAAVCSRGTYNDAKTDPADKCKTCPEGTITAPDSTATAVDSVEKCKFTLPGYGQTNETAGTALTKCPIGKYGMGNVQFGSTSACQSCGDGKTSRFEGATSQQECDICPDGQGITNNVGGVGGGKCSNCAVGFYGGGTSTFAAGSSNLACTACPGTLSTFNFYYNGSTNPVNVAATTEPGAASSQQCLLEFAPIINDIWYLKVATTAGASAVVPYDAADADACLKKCRDEASCQFFTFDYAATGTKCQLYKPSNAGTNGKKKIAYKVLASNDLGADRRRSLLADSNNHTTKPKEVGSGVWSWWNDDTASGNVGTSKTILPLNVQPTLELCLQAGNDDSECAAVVFNFGAVTATPSTVESCLCVIGELPLNGAPDSSKRSMIKYRTVYADNVKPNFATA